MSEDERRDPQGRLILPLTPSTDLHLLRRAGEILERSVNAQATDRFTAAELRFWDYQVRGMAVSLHWERDAGLSLIAGQANPAAELFARDLAVALQTKLAQEGLLD